MSGLLFLHLRFFFFARFLTVDGLTLREVCPDVVSKRDARVSDLEERRIRRANDTGLRKVKSSIYPFRQKFHSGSKWSVSIYPRRLLAFSQNVRPGEGNWPTGPELTTGKLQSLMTSRAEKGSQDLMR